MDFEKALKVLSTSAKKEDKKYVVFFKWEEKNFSLNKLDDYKDSELISLIATIVYDALERGIKYYEDWGEENQSWIGEKCNALKEAKRKYESGEEIEIKLYYTSGRILKFRK